MPALVKRQRSTPIQAHRAPHGPTSTQARSADQHSAGSTTTSVPTVADTTPKRRVPAHITGAAPDTLPPLRVRTDKGHGKTPLDQHPLRAWVRLDGALTQVGFEQALPGKATVAPGEYAPVTKRAVDAAWKKALAVRQEGLRLLLTDPDRVPSAAPVTPEDGSVRIAAYHMGFGAMDQAAEGFVEQMADVGRVEGFRNVVRVHADNTEYLASLMGGEENHNTTFVQIDSYHDIWSEDAAEVHRDRSIGVPPPMPEGMNASAEILKARIQRMCPQLRVPRTDDAAKLYAFLTAHAPQGAFSVLGQVFAREAQLTFVGLALASKQPVRVAFCAIEGGNMLVGTARDGSTHACVGRDSFELSRRAMQKELACKLDDAFVMRALSKDLGLPVEQIHIVEQPAVYHLDVMMIPIAPGEFLLNDSVAAAACVHQWALDDLARSKPQPPRHPNKEANEQFKFDLEMWTTRKSDLATHLAELSKSSQRDAAGEAQTQADLEAAGFKVHRIPAVFPWVGIQPMSFINAEQGRGRDGRRYYIALGGDRRGEEHFLKQMQTVGADIERFYFLDRELTFNTLQAGGGVNCRCKPEAALP